MEIDINFKEMEDWNSARGFRIYRLENAIGSGQGTAQNKRGTRLTRLRHISLLTSLDFQ